MATTNTKTVNTTGVTYDSGAYIAQNWIEVSPAGANIFAIEDNTLSSSLKVLGSGDTVYIEGNFADYQYKQNGKTITFDNGVARTALTLSSMTNKVLVTTTLVFLDGSVTLTNKSGGTKVSINGYDDNGNAKSQALSSTYKNVTINANDSNTAAATYFSALPVNDTTTYTLDGGVNNISLVGPTVGYGYVDAGSLASSTLNPSDQINLTGSNNTLNVTVAGSIITDATTGGSANVDASNAALITGVNTFNIRNVTTAVAGTTSGTNVVVATLNASTIASLTSVNSTLSTGTVTVTNLASGATAGVTGNGTLVTGASNFGWVATATSGTVNLTNGVKGGAIVTSGTLLAANTVNSTGAANTIGALTLGAAVTALTINATTALTTGAISNSSAPALTTLTISGAGAVNTSTTALEATVTTVNAATNSGGVTVVLGSAVTQTVTGGTGNDVITASAILTTGSVNGGAGTDTLVLGGTTVVSTSTLGAKYTNFETLRLNASQDVSLVSGITAVQLNAATSAAVSGLSATQAANVQLLGNQTTGVSFALTTATGTSDVLTITSGTGLTTGAAFSTGALTVTGFETLNFKANSGPTSTVGADRTSTIASLTGATLNSVVLTGTAVTITNAATTVAVAINGSALVGNGASTSVGLTLAGTLIAGSVVNGSAVQDALTIGGASGATYNGNAGNDIFTIAAADLTPTGVSTHDVIISGGTGTDNLTLTGAATLTDTAFTYVTGMETLTVAGGAYDQSITGLAAGFLATYATGVTVTDAATQSDGYAYTWASGLYNQNVTLTHVTSAVGTSSAANQSITTGGGADTVTLTASSYTGLTGGVTQGTLVVSTGAGVDNITVSTGTLNTAATAQAVTITAGTGADIIGVTHVNGDATTTLLGNFSFVTAAGDSSTTAYDQITGFKAATGTLVSDKLDFSNAAVNTYVATAASGYSAAELTVAVASTGAVTFAGTSAASLTVAQKIAAVQSVVTNVNGDSAFFVVGTDTYVFNNETAGDVVVELVGVSDATALITTNGATNHGIFIG